MSQRGRPRLHAPRHARERARALQGLPTTRHHAARRGQRDPIPGDPERPAHGPEEEQEERLQRPRARDGGPPRSLGRAGPSSRSAPRSTSARPSSARSRRSSAASRPRTSTSRASWSTWSRSAARSTATCSLTRFRVELRRLGRRNSGYNPVEGAPAAWIDVLARFPERLWLNPLPRSRWSAGALAVERRAPSMAGRRPEAPRQLWREARGRRGAPPAGVDACRG